MANYYHTNVAATAYTVSKQASTRTVRSMWLSGQYFSLRQTVTTEVVRYEGLGLSDARNLCVSSETSVLNGTTRNHLGGANVTNGSGAGASWMYVDACWGTVVEASMTQRSPNMYDVTISTTTLTVAAGDAGLTVTLT